MTVRVISQLLFALAAITLASVSLAPADPAPPTPAAPPPREVRIGYFANVTHAQAVLADDSGDFARAVTPSRLTTRTFNAGPSLIESLFAGEIDIGYVGPSPALNAMLLSRGKGIRIIAGAAANGVVIVARPGSGIATMQDLKGKRVATPQLGNTQDISARHYLVKQLGQTDANNVIPVANAEQSSMMSRGQIDAAWAVEPWAARLIAESGATIVAEEKDLWPDKRFILTVVVTTPEFLEKHPETIAALLNIHISWTRRLAQDASKYAPALTKALEKLTSKKLSEAVISSALSRVTFTDDPLPDSLKTFAQWAYELRLAKGVPSIAAMVDLAALEKARAAAAPSEKTATPAP